MLRVNGFYEALFQAEQRQIVSSGCGEPADVWLAASSTTPGAVGENEPAAARPLPAAGAPQERLPRPVPGLADFSPSACRIEARQAWAVMERVM